MRVVSVVGARPQIVKAAAVSKVVRREHEEVLVHTGQHYDDRMSATFFRDLDVPKPEYNLEIGSGSHGRQTGRMIEAIEEVLAKEEPDMVIVYGDTNSTLAAAVAAAKLHLPVGHVEAGVRSFDRRMAEEINRVLTDHVSTLLFAPTQTAVENLRREGITDGVCLVGDVMLDILLERVDHVDDRPVRAFGFAPGAYCFMTLHRAENVDYRHRLLEIVAALGHIDLPVAFAVHPRTRARLDDDVVAAAIPPNVILLDPLPYTDTVALQRYASAVITDSGGVQREAFWLGVPCVVLRDETEWPELLGPDMVLARRPHEGLRTLRRAPRRPLAALARSTAAPRISHALSAFSP